MIKPVNFRLLETMKKYFLQRNYDIFSTKYSKTCHILNEIATLTKQYDKLTRQLCFCLQNGKL